MPLTSVKLETRDLRRYRGARYVELEKDKLHVFLTSVCSVCGEVVRTAENILVGATPADARRSGLVYWHGPLPDKAKTLSPYNHLCLQHYHTWMYAEGEAESFV